MHNQMQEPGSDPRQSDSEVHLLNYHAVSQFHGYVCIFKRLLIYSLFPHKTLKNSKEISSFTKNWNNYFKEHSVPLETGLSKN